MVFVLNTVAHEFKTRELHFEPIESVNNADLAKSRQYLVFSNTTEQGARILPLFSISDQQGARI